MRVLDASAIIYAWDNYPVEQFPSLWNWISGEIGRSQLAIPRVALAEVTDKIPECAAWLKAQEINVLNVTNEILQDALRIKALVGIKGENYHSKGVGENDILIVATARACGADLISNEGRQALTPDNPTKRRIPAVCAMDEVSITCMNFLEHIKTSKAVFQ